jgi:hypothetical protein
VALSNGERMACSRSHRIISNARPGSRPNLSRNRRSPRAWSAIGRLAEQVNALGPTHLDHTLAGEAVEPEGDGAFARRYAMALQQRRLFMIEQGWMGEAEKHLSPAVLRTLATNERADFAKRLSGELGRPVLMQSPSQVFAASMRVASIWPKAASPSSCRSARPMLSRGARRWSGSLAVRSKACCAARLCHGDWRGAWDRICRPWDEAGRARAAEARHLHLQGERSGSTPDAVDKFTEVEAGTTSVPHVPQRTINYSQST